MVEIDLRSRGNGAQFSASAFNFETSHQFFVFPRDENNNLRNRVGRTFDGAIENFQARFFDSEQTLGLSEAVNITNLFAESGDTISPQGSVEPLTLGLTTRLVEDAINDLTLPEEIIPFVPPDLPDIPDIFVPPDLPDIPDIFVPPDLPDIPDIFGDPPDIFGDLPDIFGDPPNIFGDPPDIFGDPPDIFGDPPDSGPFIPEDMIALIEFPVVQSESTRFEPPVHLVGGEEITVARRLEYILHGEQLSSLPNNILELTLIIEDADGNDTNGFQDRNGHTIIEEDEIDDALNDIEFIIDNGLLGLSATNEQNAPSDNPFADVGLIDRIRVSVDNGSSIISTEREIDFQNNVSLLTDNNIIRAEDLSSDFIGAGDGDDVIIGSDGDDIITGGNGDDVIIGGNGDDVITGGKGADILTGGHGLDVFIIQGDKFSGAYGFNSDLQFDNQGKVLADQIIDFDEHEDILILQDMRVNGVGTVSYHRDTGNVTLTDNVNGEVTSNNVIAKLQPGLDVAVIHQGNGDWSILPEVVVGLSEL